MPNSLVAIDKIATKARVRSPAADVARALAQAVADGMCISVTKAVSRAEWGAPNKQPRRSALDA